MFHNSAHSAISFQNGTIRINLDELNCSKIELMKNKIIQTIEYPNGNSQNPVVLTLEQLKSLRRQVKSFSKELIQEGNEEKNTKFLQQSETIFSEAAWVQFLFILKFWLDDNSAKFESTDMVIEKSVNTVFDLFDNTPLERVLDLGKFLWKEKMN